MKNIKLTLLLALVVAMTATSAFADGQIPIGGRPGSEPNKTTTATITITEPNNQISEDLSDHLWTLVNILRQFRF